MIQFKFYEVVEYLKKMFWYTGDQIKEFTI